VVIKCNVHPWMRAFAFVFAHPYFEVTTKTGEFALKNVPPGTYTIEAWQEKYGAQDQTVTIGPKESKTISFTYKAAALAAK
jgi:Carboxypeptidase regulatory-like domain